MPSQRANEYKDQTIDAPVNQGETRENNALPRRPHRAMTTSLCKQRPKVRCQLQGRGGARENPDLAVCILFQL